MAIENIIYPDQVIEALHHTIKTRDPNHLMRVCSGIVEYCSDFIGDGTIHFTEAEKYLVRDISHYCQSNISVNVEYIDKLLESNRAVYLVKYKISESNSEILSQIYISTVDSCVYRLYMTSSTPTDSNV